MSGNPHADQLTFRKWLVKQLTLTRWSLPLRLSEKEMAVQLGVQVDVLREAQAERDQELKRRGQGGITRGKRRYTGPDYSELSVMMPPPIRQAWVEACQALRLESSTLLRSLVQRFLLDPQRPKLTSRTWQYRDQIFRLTRKRQGPAAKTRVTRGMQIAMDTHADRWNVTSSGVVRGIILDLLEGRTTKLKIVSFGELWGDPDRYLHPEKFSR